MKNKKKYIILIAIIIILSFIVAKLPTYAKYVYNSIWDYYLESKGFYFTSDNLSTNNIINSNSQWDGTSVYFNIKNSLNDSVSTNYDIGYTVTCSIEGDAASYSECLMNGTESNTQSGILSSSQTCSNTTGDGINVSSLNETDCELQGYNWVYQPSLKELYFDIVLTDNNYELQEVTVNVTANSTTPYVKQLTGSFILNKSAATDQIVMNYKEYSKYDRVVVSNNFSTNKNVKLRWNSDQILIDEELENFISYNMDANNYVNEVEFNIGANKSLSYIFYKRSINSNYTYNINLIEENGEEIYVIVLESSEPFIPIPNAPVLAGGMVPIKWNGSSWDDTIESDEEWYDYDNKQWANARTQDGSMWVWIPRYTYKITSKWHESVVDATDAGTIDINFSNGTDDTLGGRLSIDTRITSEASNALTNGNKYTNHPAFTFGNTELTGIWVAKFEASTLMEDSCYKRPGSSNCDKSTLAIQILPNRTTWRYVSIGNVFVASRNMETNIMYGWNTSSTLQSNGTFAIDNNNLDTHLIKNVEWGAVAYLSKSKYGKETEEVWINNVSSYISGCAGTSATSMSNSTCYYPYQTSNGVQASTTGNVYGIYDMSGGAYDMVAMYLNNSDSNLTTYASQLVNAHNKYKDVYEANTPNDKENNYLLAVNKKGDAVYETSGNGILTQLGWYKDVTDFSFELASCINRGANYVGGSNAGLFAFMSYGCSNLSVYGFRPAIVVGSGL